MLNVRDLWSMVGASFALVGLYLLLTNYTGAKEIAGTLGDKYIGLIKTLQGRG